MTRITLLFFLFGPIFLYSGKGSADNEVTFEAIISNLNKKALINPLIPINIQKLKLLEEIDSLFVADSSLSFNNGIPRYKYPGRAMLLSAILPGLGELYAGSPLKAFLFAGMEAGAWYFWKRTRDNMTTKESEYKRFADEHWDFGRWVTHYYDYYNMRNNPINSMNLYQLYSQETNGIPTMFGSYNSNFEQIIEWNDINNDGIQDDSEIIEWNYTHINDGSHSIAFWDPRYQEFKTFPKNTPPSAESNGYFYCDDFNTASFDCNKFVLDESFNAELDNFIVQKNLHFYENIGKYNQFFMGWDDALFSTENFDVESETVNIGTDIENYIVTALSIDLTEPWNPDTSTIILTNDFSYDKKSGELTINSEINSDLERFQVTFTKASIFDNDGYLVPKSPNKWIYRDLRDEYNQLGKLAGYAMTTVMFNHVISMIDAVITSNLYNRKHNSIKNISIEPILDTDAKLGVGGIKFNFRF